MNSARVADGDVRGHATVFVDGSEYLGRVVEGAPWGGGRGTRCVEGWRCGVAVGVVVVVGGVAVAISISIPVAVSVSMFVAIGVAVADARRRRRRVGGR